MTIHQRIKERRLALGMQSHKALADALGVAWQTVQLWEKEGGTAPNRNRIEAVAKALNVTPSWLLHGGEMPSSANSVKPQQEKKDVKRSPNPGLQFIDEQEYYLLNLFRCTDDEGRAEIIGTAEAMPRVLLPGIVKNKA